MFDIDFYKTMLVSRAQEKLEVLMEDVDDGNLDVVRKVKLLINNFAELLAALELLNKLDTCKVGFIYDEVQIEEKDMSEILSGPGKDDTFLCLNFRFIDPNKSFIISTNTSRHEDEPRYVCIVGGKIDAGKLVNLGDYIRIVMLLSKSGE